MPDKKDNSKKGNFSLVPIILSEPIKNTDGFTNLIEETPATSSQVLDKKIDAGESNKTEAKKTKSVKSKIGAKESKQIKQSIDNINSTEKTQSETVNSQETVKKNVKDERLSVDELLQILGADNLNEIYELSDVLRASSLKLYAALVELADSRGRVRVKNHELMSKAGIKGIATLYKQERWLTELKLVEKKAKPGPHDGSSYFVFKLETLPLPKEIFDKFDEYLSSSN